MLNGSSPNSLASIPSPKRNPRKNCFSFPSSINVVRYLCCPSTTSSICGSSQTHFEFGKSIGQFLLSLLHPVRMIVSMSKSAPIRRAILFFNVIRTYKHPTINIILKIIELTSVFNPSGRVVHFYFARYGSRDSNRVSTLKWVDCYRITRIILKCPIPESDNCHAAATAQL